MLKNLRRLVAITLLNFFLLGFIVIPIHLNWDFWVADIQFVPSYMGSMTGEEFALAVFIALLALTLLFGRVFCSWICPLGIAQDVAHRIGTPRGRYKGLASRYTKNHWIIRGVFLLLTLITLVLGSSYILSWLDPYSISARFGTAVIEPLATQIYSASGKTAQVADWGRYSPLVLSIIIITVLIPLMMALRKGRLYCNTICPVGTFLGLLSRVAPCTPYIKDKSCVRCMTCTTHCKAHAIDIKNLRIDSTRCISCYRCIGVCDSDAITLMPHHPFAPAVEAAPRVPKKQTSPTLSPDKNADNTRRALLGLGLTGVVTTLFPSCRASAEDIDAQYSDDPSELGNNKARYPIPPGAGSHEIFLDACTGCSLCISACPTQVLKPALTELGWEGINKPFLAIGDAQCAYSCHSCADACPENAIKELPLALKKRTQIALAAIDQRHCIVWQDHEECVKCVQACPTKALKEKDASVPEIVPSACVACNHCVEVCPVKTISLQEVTVNGKSKKIAVIDFANCTGCGECAYTCPHNAIEVTDLISPELEAQLCNGCGSCVVACPSRPVRAMSVTARAKQLTLSENSVEN